MDFIELKLTNRLVILVFFGMSVNKPKICRSAIGTPAIMPPSSSQKRSLGRRLGQSLGRKLRGFTDMQARLIYTKC